jgi:drug/metabolite transporter (DMT)-like permease
MITTYSTLLALLMTTPFMIVEFRESLLSSLLKPDIGLSILYLGIVATAVAFYLWNKGIEYLEAGIGSIFYFFAPLISAFFGWALLGEHLNWNFFLGGFFIFFGVGYITLTGDGRKPKPEHRGLRSTQYEK